MYEYMIERYIYNEQNGLWYELRGNFTFLAWNYRAKKKNGLSAYRDSGICGISVNIKRLFTPVF